MSIQPAEVLGLTKREHFAIHIMAALKNQIDPGSGEDAYAHDTAAKAAVICADLLIRELNESPEAV